MKYLFLILLFGCDFEAVLMEQYPHHMQTKTVCIDGVTYLYYSKYREAYMAVKLNKNSKIIECKEGEK